MNNSITPLQAKKMLLSSPWDTIQETIEEKAMTQTELAKELKEPLKNIQELSQGTLPITHLLANKLEHVLGISASLWLNLEKRYRKELLEIQQMENLQNSQKSNSKVVS
jgi:HTH-type transcriptional regulator/antitoxin HigA